MKKLLMLMAAGTAMLLAVACEEYPVTGPDQTTNVTVIVNSGTPTPGAPSATPAAGCAAVASVGVSARDANNIVVGSGNTPGVLIVGQTYQLDASPKDANGRLIEPTSCHAPAGRWVDTPTGLVTLLGDVNGFNPRLLAAKAGDVTVRFTLGAGPGEGLYGEMKFRVQ